MVAAAGPTGISGARLCAALMGWLTASGVSIMALAALTPSPVIGADTALTARRTPTEVVTLLVLVLVLVIAYGCGGYVAARLAPVAGTLQAVGVWLWAIAVSAIVILADSVWGSQLGDLPSVGALPGLPPGGRTMLGGVFALIAILAATLLGATAGAYLGVRLHETRRRSSRLSARALRRSTTRRPGTVRRGSDAR